MGSPDAPQRKRLRIAGQVQGVGFRPFVYRLAADLGLSGHVANDGRGVTVEFQGRPDALGRFVPRLLAEMPPLAEVQQIDAEDLPPAPAEEGFQILPSRTSELADAQVTVDTAACADCLREMNDPDDPRYRYPFINCTNCGPRYTIVRRIPYDRPNTTMAEFAMCPLCARQYRDPADRRFHAQPVACPRCGPAAWLVDAAGRQIDCDDPIAEAARLLRGGAIVAIKGLGGYHLACRADDDHAVGRLRRRKRRDAKPFALMAADLEQVRGICEVNDAAARLLTGPIRPILLLPRRPGAAVARGVADGLDTLGVMLPYTPLHHLLLAHGLGPLIMTSGNYSDEPLVKDNDEAIATLGGMADALLVHNRPIARRLDDSVVQLHHDGTTAVLRRARGYAPRPVHLPELAAEPPDGPAVLAVGAELKNAVCLFRGGRAVLGQHVGDLKDGRTYRHFIRTIDHLEELFEFQPDLLAADVHPQYLSTSYAVRRHLGQMPGRPVLPLVRVQHHHAHIVACLAEHGRTGPAIGLACDGVGYGEDGSVWGCEVLRADATEFERLGHLRTVPLVGGDAAAEETFRPAVAALWDAFGAQAAREWALRLLSADGDQIDAALEMIAAGVNCPACSSLGRWFDAVAGLCGLAAANRYEGEAPMRLESAAAGGVSAVYPYRVSGGDPFEIDLRPMVEAMTAELAEGADLPCVSACFHNTVSALLADSARRAREATGLKVVALSGGCFANRYLTMRLAEELEADGFEVLRHRVIPCNDGGVALGQAVVAAARWRRQEGRTQPADRDGKVRSHDVSGSTGSDRAGT